MSAPVFETGLRRDDPASRTGWSWALPAVLLLAVALRLAYGFASAPVDDAYITYRYSQNIASGEGFVFNPGEHVLGTTTPLFTLILTAPALLGIPVDVFAVALNIVLDVLVCLIVFLWIRRELGFAFGVVSAVLYAGFYASAAACGYGMETQLFQLLVVGSFALACRGRRLTAWLLAGLATLTRPEGVLAAGVLGLVLIYEWRRGGGAPPWKPPAVYLAVLAPWLVFATLYFGSPAPNSLLAKSFQSSVSAGETLGFFVSRNPLLALLWAGSATGALIWLLRRPDAAGVSTGARPGLAVFLLTAWATLYLLFFLAGSPPFLGPWYFPPVAPALVTLSGLAAVAVLGMILRSERAVVVAAVAAWILVTGAVLPRSLAAARWMKKTADVVYRPMGLWARESTAPSDVIQISDIGYVGYLSGRRLLDFSALVSPEVWRFYRDHPDDPLRDVHLVLHRRPEWVVLPIKGKIWSRFRDGGFLDVYRPVRRFQTNGETDLTFESDPGPGYGGSSHYVADFIAYRRIDGP